MYCWKCSFQHPESEIVCPLCGSANAPGQSFATPPTVSSPGAHDLEAEWTRTHRVGHHIPGGLHLLLVLVGFLVIGMILSFLFGH